MKIVHIVQYLMQGHTYQENYLPHAMARLGHEVTILAGTQNPDFYTDAPHEKGDTVLDHDGVKIVYTPMRYRSLWSEIDGIEALLDAEKPDLLYVHGFLLTRCFALARWQMRNQDCVCVADTHETYPLAFNACFSGSVKDRIRYFVYFRCVYRWWKNFVERRYRRVFYVSPPRKRFAMQALGFREEMLTDLWLGADLATLPYGRKEALRASARAELGLAPEERIVILAGKLDALKHPVELAEAFFRIRAPGWTLLYVGSLPEELKRRIEEIADGSDKLRMIGFVPGERVLEWIAASDLAAYPGAPSVLWQQTVCLGIPALFFELVRDDAAYLSDESAVLLQTGSADEVEQSLRPLLADPERLAAMGARARAHGERILSYDKLAQKVLDIAAKTSDKKEEIGESYGRE